MDVSYKLLIIGWVICLIWVPYIIFTNRKVQPSALFLLFFAELWERFSYYGMRGLLVLYMIDKGGDLVYDQSTAYAVYGAYGAMVYATPVIGGLIAEQLFGYRKAILWGGILMALGHFAMAFPLEPVFFIALALLILGNGFFKPNISSFVGTFYEENDVRRDRGFNLFYMGINVGAFLAPLTCGAIGQDPNLGWHYGFGLAGIGMVIGVIVFIVGLRNGVFKDNGYSPNPELLKSKKKFGISNENAIYVGTFLAVGVIYFLLNTGGRGIVHIGEALTGGTAFKFGFEPEGGFANFAQSIELSMLDFILITLVISMIVYLYRHGAKMGKVQGDKIKVIIFLFLFTTLFWTFFELAGSAISVFTELNVDRSIPFLDENNPIKASQFQSVNPLFIIILAPAFNWLWNLLRKRNLEPNVPVKFAIGVTFLGLGFFMFPLGGGFAENGMVPMIFLLLAYLLHTVGELCLSPVGLSLVTKLSPKQIVGFVMGFWFLSSSLAHLLGKFIAQETDSGNLGPVEALEQFNGVFWMVGAIAVGAGVLLFAASPVIKKWMHGVE